MFYRSSDVKLRIVKSDFDESQLKALEDFFVQRIEKGLMHMNVGAVVSVELEWV